MIDISIKVKRQQKRYSVSVVLGKSYIMADFDSGAESTVISVDAFFDVMSEDNKNLVKSYFDNKGIKEKVFKSASGDEIYGYPVIATNVRVGGVVFPKFMYYLILNSKRSIALIGYDFINNAILSCPF